jgi:tetratricopeptide (TPR) repeat protein
MIELKDDDEQAKEEMIAVCRQNSFDDKRDTKAIKEFENESLDENARNAVNWYTKNSIIARLINEALVSGNIARIYSYRYLIKLICRQLTKLHKQYQKSYKEHNLHLYRGLVLKSSEIHRLSKHENVLISLNGFISTSKDEDVAKRFCSSRKKFDHKPVIFEIDIDMTSEQSIAFADISEFSQYPDEEEILLSIGSVFRIESVRFDEIEQLYRIHLSLRQHDQLTVNKYIEQTFPNEGDSSDLSVLFGKLLFDMGEYEFAIEYFKNRIECLSNVDNHHRPTYLNNIGVCYNEIGNKEQALIHYKTASKIYAHADNHRGLGACYHNVNHHISISLLLTSSFLL